MAIPKIDFERVDELIRLALAEDLGELGDTTTLAVIPAGLGATAELIAKSPCVCAGLPVAERVFFNVDRSLESTALAEEGAACAPGTVMARVKGSARSLLTAERTALNFLQRLCGIATTARKYAEALAASDTRILDTRKTTPGFRNLEKYAVAVGGATNHRIGLYDRIMIKDNHRELAGMEGPGGIARSVERARQMYPQLKVQVEVDNLAELREAVAAKADYILLDNMDDATMAEAVRINNRAALLEASGGITLERLGAIGKLGVDFVSAGALTHSVKAADISMDIRKD